VQESDHNLIFSFFFILYYFERMLLLRMVISVRRQLAFSFQDLAKMNKRENENENEKYEKYENER
jgi:hypothetical protein